MEITFTPDSDLEDFTQAVTEYREIWSHDGARFTSVWEEVTGLRFRETYINATVFHRPSFSHPLSLNALPDRERKKSILIHELGHRLLYKRTIQPDFSSLENHKTLFLVLFEVFEKIYNRDFAEQAVVWDRTTTNPVYGEAWDWALSLTPEQRKSEFAERLLST